MSSFNMDEIDYLLLNIPLITNPVYNDTHIALGLIKHPQVYCGTKMTINGLEIFIHVIFLSHTNIHYFFPH